jgi:Kef-type K+ transport system membrane component KefB
LTSGSIFLVQALVVVAFPVVLLRLSGLKGLVPLVVVQIAVGIALGPSLFGRLAPEWYNLFFSHEAISALSGIGSVAVLAFGLITGLHLDSGILWAKGRSFLAVAVANVVVPTALGSLAGYWIVARHSEELAPGLSPTEFALAVGICIGMTALPVLGAILREMDLLGRRIGHLALGIAGVNDTALWILLSALLTMVGGQAIGAVGVLTRFFFVPVYLVVMVHVVRPWLVRMVIARMRDEVVNERALVVVGAVTIASAFATESMGLHYIIGAFVTGAVIPPNLRKPLLDRLQVMTVVLLMPFFFTLTGLRTFIDPSSSAFLELFILATVVAVVGIIGGTGVAGRLAGEPWPLALALGALLQTKGLMELIVLTVLLDARIISANVFAALVLMAVVSTALAMPVARLVLARDNKRQRRAQPVTSPTARSKGVGTYEDEGIPAFGIISAPDLTQERTNDQAG